MKYLTVCSGIDAPSVAWRPLGFEPVGFSEIEPFPSAVLAHRFPDVPNLGDMTRYKEWDVGPFQWLAGGTPCQSFSVAGLRKGMADPRGNLALVFLGIADHFRPDGLVWENVPGVLSSNGGRDFGAFLGALGELGYGWAYRVLDAQYVRVDGYDRAVPQRRRRVFVVGCLGDWRRAVSILFERESLSGNPAPSRETRSRIAASLTAGAARGSGVNPPGRRKEDDVNLVCNALDSFSGGPDDNSAQGNHLVAHTLKAEGHDASEDGTGRGVPLVSLCLNAGGMRRQDYETETVVPVAFGHNKPAAHTMRIDDVTDALQASPTSNPAIAYQRQGNGNETGGVPFTISVHGRNGDQELQFRDDGLADTVRADAGGVTRTGAIATRYAVRRLTPRECERLQGFPDDWTLVPFKGKPATDSPRYRAIGNSMAVNVVRWIGRRIQEGAA